MKRPTFFVSSTIFDFLDLRSAIKYYLEQQGCIVLASEYNDFQKTLDVHSYQACLDSIHQADYFLLLIGSRVGGWYNKENNISITQREYREAYKLHLEGRMKIISFVRSEIWNLRTDRAELERYLNTLNIDNRISTSILHHPTKRTSNPRFIIDFVNEVSRIKDTKYAINSGGPLPTGNWLHVFNSFKDVIDVIQPEVFDGTLIEEEVTKRLLLSELREILRKSLVKYKENAVYSPTNTIRKFYSEHEFEHNISEDHYTSVNTKHWNSLSTLAMHLIALKLNPLILPQALSSSVFLRYESSMGIFEETPVHQALHLLQQEINSLNISNTTEALVVVFEHSPRNRHEDNNTIALKTTDLLTLLHLLLRWSNVITISKAIILYLEGGMFIMPEIFEKSPILGKNKELEKETVTQEELDGFLSE